MNYIARQNYIHTKPKNVLVVFASLLIFLPIISFAHPGNTYSDGSHHCWTRCAYWGVEYGKIHYHNSGYSTTVEEPDYSSLFQTPTTYQIGSRSTVVEDIQTKLASDSSIYPEGIVSGYYGHLTEKAVQRFQIRHGLSYYGLSNFGKVDKVTKAKIDEVYSLANRIESMSVSNAQHESEPTIEELQKMIDDLLFQIDSLQTAIESI